MTASRQQLKAESMRRRLDAAKAYDTAIDDVLKVLEEKRNGSVSEAIEAVGKMKKGRSNGAPE